MGEKECKAINAGRRERGPDWVAPVLGKGGMEDVQPGCVLRVVQYALNEGVQVFVAEPFNNLGE